MKKKINNIFNVDFLSICVIVWDITKMYIAHEKDF